MIDKAFSEFDETYCNKMLENNSVYFDQRIKKNIKTEEFWLVERTNRVLDFRTRKRLRPLLCMETSKVFNIPSEISIFCAIAIECIHTYSLVHDDLPSMDDDDLRRGQPTVPTKNGMKQLPF